MHGEVYILITIKDLSKCNIDKGMLQTQEDYEKKMNGEVDECEADECFYCPCGEDVDHEDEYCQDCIEEDLLRDEWKEEQKKEKEQVILDNKNRFIDDDYEYTE
jgi:hypothetical protein